MLQELEKSAYATSLDLNMGYYTVRLHPDSQNLCTIVTPFGKYQYLRLPMRISCSPYIFQEKIVKLRPLPQPRMRAHTHKQIQAPREPPN
jgi:hypothetical protein